MEGPIPRAVLDASVLVPRWSRLLLSRLAESRPRLFTPIWCEWIIAETWRVLAVQRLRDYPQISRAEERQLSVAANTMLLKLLPHMEFISVVPPFSPAWATATDENDLPIWTAAVLGQATFVVSHNLHDFPPRSADGLCTFQGIEFITPENFIREVLTLPSDVLAALAIPQGGRIIHQRQRQ